MATATEIRAIETHYDGYRFRSRLEARWAIFFNTLGMAWEYEKEGYELPDGTRYLPDFWLPEYRSWAEIKPDEFTPEELKKCQQLSDGTKSACLLLSGLPDYREYDQLCGSYDNKPIIAPVTVCTAYKDEQRFFVMGYPAPGDIYYFEQFDRNYTTAINAARSARFEFGSNG